MMGLSLKIEEVSSDGEHYSSRCKVAPKEGKIRVSIEGNANSSNIRSPDANVQLVFSLIMPVVVATLAH